MRTVFVDVDTQLDFVVPSGALYAPGSERIIPTVAALNRHAAASGSPLISTMDAHRENDPEFRTWPGHCIAGTLGQRKPESTLLASRVVIPSKWRPVGDFAPQILLEKQHLDCFTNENLGEILRRLEADRYVVYGVVTEYCVRFAAFGLLATGKPVQIVSDAIRSLNDGDAATTLREFVAQGGEVVNSTTVLRP